MNWNIRNDAPVYTQLVDQIARAIILGQFPPGSRLPSVREFAADAGVNPNTMQRALAELERLELIRTQRTAGLWQQKTRSIHPDLRLQISPRLPRIPQ